MVKFRSSRHHRGGWKGGVRFTPARPNTSTAPDDGKSIASHSAKSETSNVPNAGTTASRPPAANGNATACAHEKLKTPFVEVRVDAFWNILPESDNTFCIAYKGLCGLNHPGVNGGEGVYFEFTERVPCHLCFRACGIPAPMNCNETGKYIAGVVSRHNQRIMDARDWECQFCGQVAHEMCHAPIPFFNPAVGDPPDFRPSIWDFVVPICRSLSECDVKAEKLTVELVKKRFRGPVVISGPSCQKCGSMNDLMTCGGCSCIR